MEAMQTHHERTQSTRPTPPDEASLRRFRLNLDALIARNPEPETLINALLDFFGTRCATARELRQAGEAVFAALNSASPRPAVVGRYHERFLFRRIADDVEVTAEGQRLATLRLDEAIRLATLLHGVSDATPGRLRAA